MKSYYWKSIATWFDPRVVRSNNSDEAYPDVDPHLDGEPVDEEVGNEDGLVAGLLEKVEDNFKGVLAPWEDFYLKDILSIILDN